VRNKLLNDEHWRCLCGKEEIRVDSIIPNESLRASVQSFRATQQQQSARNIALAPTASVATTPAVAPIRPPEPFVSRVSFFLILPDCIFLLLVNAITASNLVTLLKIVPFGYVSLPKLLLSISSHNQCIPACTADAIRAADADAAGHATTCNDGLWFWNAPAGPHVSSALPDVSTHGAARACADAAIRTATPSWYHEPSAI
jgi:hypothetical protein